MSAATPNRRAGFSHSAASFQAAPFLTPRPEKRQQADLRWADGSSSAARPDKDRDVNVQVVVRCRPLNEEEQRFSSQKEKAVSCNEQRREVGVSQGSTSKLGEKTFAFDKVFGPSTQQRTLYEYVIAPLVKDVLEGFNCTVFAYGQTGTGKTYTIEGETKSKGGELPGDAGMIPRAFCHIFDELEAQKADYTMKVTFFELYNEEINDLLASEDQSRFPDDKQRRPISVMEDGKGGAVIRGLQEEVVYGSCDVYNLLERGSAKRKNTDTLLNKQSSRSHSVFSITINARETVLGGSDLVRCGRLNLVDLAGSESISKSGARDGRAREAGEINKSLLTLGRVITALTEHSAHIPYRDSKLTRLLRESLGGKEKTCIIATISPSIHCVEETLCTLDYAYRARSIRNRPEANRKFSKSVLLKDLYSEIDRLKQDLGAAREKNGIYIPQERFEQEEAEKQSMYGKIEQLELELDLQRKEARRFQGLYHSEEERGLDLESELMERKKLMESCTKALQDLQEAQKLANSNMKEKEFIIAKLLQSEDALLQRAKELHGSLENASEDVSMLWNKIEQQEETDSGNHGLILNFGSELGQRLKDLHKMVIGSVCRNQELLRSMEEHQCSFLAAKCEATKFLETRIGDLRATYNTGVQGMKDLANALQINTFVDLEHAKSAISSNTMAVENFLVTAASEAEHVLCDVERSIVEQKEMLDLSYKQHEAGLQRSLVSTDAISRATADFFNDLQRRASKIMSVIEENEVKKSHQIGKFEKKFKELSAEEEKIALEKIAGILSAVRAKNENMVMEALASMCETIHEEKEELQLQVSTMQQVSSDARSDWVAYIEKAESHLQGDASLAAETWNAMDGMIESCSKKVGQSRQYWGVANSSIRQLNSCFAAEVDSYLDERSEEHKSIFGKFMSVASRTGMDFEGGASDLLTTANDSLMWDQEAKERTESMARSCHAGLARMQAVHDDGIKGMRSLADECLLKEYKVGRPSGGDLRSARRAIAVPLLVSIEGLRSAPLAELVREAFKQDGKTKGPSEADQWKQQQQQLLLLTPSPRTTKSHPLSTVN